MERWCMEMVHRALAAHSVDELLRGVAEVIIEAGGLRSLMVALVDQDLEIVEVRVNGIVRHGCIAFDDDRGLVGVQYRLDEKDILAEVARCGQAEVIVGWDERFNEELLDPDRHVDRVAYFIPVKRGNGVLAVLGTGSQVADKEEVEARLEGLSPLLEPVAVVLENSLSSAALEQEKQALERFDDGRFEVVIVDLAMVGMPGDRLVREMRRIDPAISTVLITGWELQEIEARKELFDFAVQKPFEGPQKLLNIVGQALALRDRRVAGGAVKEAEEASVS